MSHHDQMHAGKMMDMSMDHEHTHQQTDMASMQMSHHDMGHMAMDHSGMDMHMDHGNMDHGGGHMMQYGQFEAEVLGQPHCHDPRAIIGPVYGHEYSSQGH